MTMKMSTQCLSTELHFDDTERLKRLRPYHYLILAYWLNLNSQKLQYEMTEKLMEQFICLANRKGCRRKNLIEKLNELESRRIPKTKIAILVGNSNYKSGKLPTPCFDVDSIAVQLKNVGFSSVLFKNVKTNAFKRMFAEIVKLVPEESYIFFYYAGHGFEIKNSPNSSPENDSKYILGVEFTGDAIKDVNCISERFILEQICDRNPLLSVSTLDMCRYIVPCEAEDYNTNELTQCGLEMTKLNLNGKIIRNYSAGVNESAFEKAVIENPISVDLLRSTLRSMNTSAINRAKPTSSQYTSVLCKKIPRNLEVSSMFDKIHKELEKSKPVQNGVKEEHGFGSYFLFDYCDQCAQLKLKLDITSYITSKENVQFISDLSL